MHSEAAVLRIFEFTVGNTASQQTSTTKPETTACKITFPTWYPYGLPAMPPDSAKRAEDSHRLARNVSVVNGLAKAAVGISG